MPSSTATVARLLRLICLVQGGGGWNAKRLADHLSVSERSIYRDIDRLKESGIPLDHDPERNGYGIAKGFFLPPVDLSVEETAALVLLSACADATDAIPLTQPAARAVEKLRAGLPGAFREELGGFWPRTAVDLARGEPQGSTDDVWSTASRAIAQSRCVRCVYESVHRSSPAGDGGEEESFLLEPSHLWWAKRAWYLFATARPDTGPRLFKLSRFAAFHLSDQPAPAADPGDLRRWLGNAWRMIPGPAEEVAVRFRSGFAETVEDTLWHPTQEADHHEDGSLTLRFRVDGLDEIVWWVLGFGPGAVVERPPALRNRVANLTAEALCAYRQPPR